MQDWRGKDTKTDEDYAGLTINNENIASIGLTLRRAVDLTNDRGQGR